MIKELQDPHLNKIIEAIENQTANHTIILDDFGVAHLLASYSSPPFVYIVPNHEDAINAGQEFENRGLRPACVTVAPDLPIYTNTKPNTDMYTKVAKFRDGGYNALIISAALLLHNVPACDSIKLSTGEKTDLKTLASLIEELGYGRVTRIDNYGQFQLRGDVLDIWTEGDRTLTRVMFFGNTVEEIRKLDPSTLVTVQKLSNIAIPSANTIGQENLETMSNILCVTKDTTNKIIINRPRQVTEVLKSTQKLNTTRLASLIEGKLIGPEFAKCFCTYSEVARELEQKAVLLLASRSDGTGGTDRLALRTAPVINYNNSLTALVPDIVNAVNTLKKTVLVFVGNSRALESYLLSKNIEFHRATPSAFQPGKINIINQRLYSSFELVDSKIIVYSLNATTPASDGPKQAAPQKQTRFALPHVGEAVVHEFHGIGRYLGLEKMKLIETEPEKDYILLQYDGGALVYLPHDQIHMLTNYHGEPTRLNRIGGKDFTAVKQRVRRRLRELSFELSRLYARRMRAKSNTYNIDKGVMAEFKQAFLHPLTPDQEKTLADIENDMAGDRVMDRLVCGDVGFGKTEVAMHAAFRAIQSGFQVALLCPTTILSMQHEATARTRLGPFGIRVAVLNRFKSDKEVNAILGDLASGELDIVIGTHRLLSSDIKFKNLGLLILDEEQRFGVGHKERIKQIKSNIDVLTLSATPIPRTLNMALSGIRDLSTINTPPPGRFPVITYVTEYSDALIRDAIEREHARGGQTLVLFNNVERIDTFTARLKKLVPASIRINHIHGQMTDTRLEDTILGMYNGEIDVLVSSTIIENGIDIQTANTLIVIDADRLGLAQMHQLRGRVGRSNDQAYAYFTYPANKELTEVATNRLRAIQTNSSHGAGYQIAMRDLQIRGAGDLLGAEQSGHMEQVGFEIYCRILREVAAELESDT